jgi:hypothetical protein
LFTTRTRAILRAEDFIGNKLPYTFKYWTANGVQRCMESHMMHVGGERLDNEVVWTFREEIDFRLQDREFAFCGTLGREFIPL